MDRDQVIVRDPSICGGEPVIRGTRVPLRAVLASLADGDRFEEILRAFPTLSERDLRAVVRLAAASVDRPAPRGKEFRTRNRGNGLLRFRLRTALLLPVLAALALTIGNAIWATWIAPDLRLQAWRAAYSHALSLGTLSPSVRAERDRLRARIGPALRADLLALAERYPQLKTTNHGTLTDSLAKSDSPGGPDVSVAHHDGLGGEARGTLAPEDQYVFDAILFEASLDRSTEIVVQRPPSLIFPHLHLWGYTEAWAGSWWLDRELKSILDRHLAPLVELEARVARTPIPAQRPPGAAAPTRRPVAPS